jgi:hypothetical protein
MKNPANRPKPLSDLPTLAAPAQRALASVGVDTLMRLSLFTEADIDALHGIGPDALTSLKSAMRAKKLSFAKR